MVTALNDLVGLGVLGVFQTKFMDAGISGP